MLIKTIDGAPDAVKVACPVWSGGKDGDNFKVLPITIERNRTASGTDAVSAPRSSAGRTELRHDHGDVRLGTGKRRGRGLRVPSGHFV